MGACSAPHRKRPKFQAMAAPKMPQPTIKMSRCMVKPSQPLSPLKSPSGHRKRIRSLGVGLGFPDRRRESLVLTGKGSGNIVHRHDRPIRSMPIRPQFQRRVSGKQFQIAAGFLRRPEPVLASGGFRAAEAFSTRSMLHRAVAPWVALHAHARTLTGP